MAERYCDPTSQNCWFGVMGSMFFQNTSRSRAYVIFVGSKTTSTASTCPVRPEDTSS
jgi:hypothetical protein